ncbi:hypothetical protein EUA35_18890 [Bacillus subtilis]|nr:hypothetical protein EUA35_18890 [Bacillus subtilis]
MFLKQIQIHLHFYKKTEAFTGLTPVFETGIKTPFKQPIADNLSVIGCLVSFELEKTPPSLISDNNHPYSNLKVFLFVSSYGVSPRFPASGFFSSIS